MTKTANNFLFTFVVSLILLLTPVTTKADNPAHGIWSVGVQIGFAEMGANQGVSTSLIIQALTYARASAIQSGCIPTGDIDQLIRAVRATRNSKTVFRQIQSYRIRLADYIVRNCSCPGNTQSGGGSIGDTGSIGSGNTGSSNARCGLGAVWNETESGWRGIWTRRGSSNVFDARWTRRGYRDVRATLSVSLRGNSITISRRDIGDPNNSGVTSCYYRGTIASNGVTVNGTYYCNTRRGRTPTYRWGATIDCDGIASNDTGGPSVTGCTAQSWVGKWRTNYGEMNLAISGNRVTGFYRDRVSYVEGVVRRSGNYCVLVGRWKRTNSRSNGPIYFVLTSDDKFTGRWDYAGRAVSLTSALQRSNWSGTKVNGSSDGGNGTISGTVKTLSWTSGAGVRGAVGQRYSFNCKPRGNSRHGSVWGTHTYTSDSSVCTAAAHAGVISQRGGTVTIEFRPGLSRYVSSTRYGITSRSYGRWGLSFVFVR